MKINNYINDKTVYFINSTDKHGVLSQLISKATEFNSETSQTLKKAIEERESLLSTGIGLGVAIPHATLPQLEDFIILTGILKTPVEWDSIDKKPVSLVFLIASPTASHTQYLKLLSQLVLIVKNSEKRECLLYAESVNEIISCFG